NYCEVIGASARPDGGTALAVRDVLNGGQAEIGARVAVNATGAWFEPVTEQLAARRPGAVRTTKGVHLVVPPVTDRALVLYSQVDRRLLFAIPRCGLTWIGTTDTDFDGDPADARATRADVDYLLASVRNVFPALRLDDVLYTTAGVRALVRQRGSESSVSRMHKIVVGGPIAPAGMISVLGGKITGYRAIAEDVSDAVCRQLGATGRRAVTAERPLPGAPSNGAHAPIVPAHLFDLYGRRAEDVLALAASTPGLDRPLAPNYPDMGAQVVFSVRHEYCVRLSDFLRRRTLLGASDDQGWAAAPAAAAVMASELGWSAGRVAGEIEAYQREIEATRSF
ncbi:MAG: glycerol-3-phosphate dehydrogenase/oxidase, partial [Vicinamibacterales bacterium]